jgi:predicted DNA-binding transcriptional regulator AlpA
VTKPQRALHAISSLVAAPTTTSNASSSISDVRLYRLPQVLARIPVSRSSWFAGIKAGLYPSGLHLGARTTVWRSDDIDRLIERLGAPV